MKSFGLHFNPTEPPVGTTSHLANSSLPKTWGPAVNSPAKKSALPVLIQPPQSANVQTCNGALRAAANKSSEMKITLPIKAALPSLLSAGTYRCTAGKGAERNYTFIALRDTHRRP